MNYRPTNRGIIGLEPNEFVRLLTTGARLNLPKGATIVDARWNWWMDKVELKMEHASFAPGLEDECIRLINAEVIEPKQEAVK